MLSSGGKGGSTCITTNCVTVDFETNGGRAVICIDILVVGVTAVSGQDK